MIGFNDILQNIGDFARAQWTPGESTSPARQHEGARGERLTPAFDGMSNAYTDDDIRGYRTPRSPQRLSAREVKRRYERDLMEATRLIKAAFDGNSYARLMMRDAMRGGFREALSISDFPNLFGDVIDRAVLANYVETPYTWNLIAKEAEVSDFREVKRFRIDGGTGLLGATDSSGNIIPIEQGGPYGEDKLVDGLFSYRVQKYGKRMPFFWETFINDDLNAIKDTPARFGQGARRSEEYFVTKLFANNTTFFSAGNKNIVVPIGVYSATNPALSITALAQAMVILANQVDTTGQPITIESMTLVVPQSLKVTAQNILNADYFWANDQGGTLSGSTSAQRLNVRNWAKNIVDLAVNYYLRVVDTSHGDTGWYLFANPNNGRPALEFGKLRGHKMPELFMKLPNSIGIGEGALGPGNAAAGMSAGNLMAPMEGDFDADAIHYKVRHVFGGTQIDPIMAVYSNGSGA